MKNSDMQETKNADDFFTMAPKYRTKERLQKLFNEAIEKAASAGYDNGYSDGLADGQDR